MIVIRSGELRDNLKKYLDLAEKERIVIRRGKTEVFELRKKNPLSNDPFFDDPENIKAIEKGIEDIKAGRYKKLDTSKTIWENIL
jgi:hypothetical protein